MGSKMYEFDKLQREIRKDNAQYEDELKELKPQIEKLRKGLGKIKLQVQSIKEISQLAGEKEESQDLKQARVREHNIANEKEPDASRAARRKETTT